MAHNRLPGTSILPNWEHCVACPSSNWPSFGCHWQPERVHAFLANVPAVQFERQSNLCHLLHHLFAIARNHRKCCDTLIPIPTELLPSILHVRCHTPWPMCTRGMHSQRHSMPGRPPLGNYFPNRCAVCNATSICRLPFSRRAASLYQKWWNRIMISNWQKWELNFVFLTGFDATIHTFTFWQIHLNTIQPHFIFGERFIGYNRCFGTQLKNEHKNN